MKHLIFIFTFLSFINALAQEKFKIKGVEGKDYKTIYYIINEKGKTVKQLDTTKYLICFTGEKYGYFAVFFINGYSSWCAIDINEKIYSMFTTQVMVSHHRMI